MPRPKSEHPTPGELEVLKVLWDRGPCTVRQVWEVLNEQRRRHYTSVNSLLNVMTDKGLLKCNAEGRAFLYAASVDRENTAGQLAEDLVGRVFEGSASGLLLQVLDRCNPSPEEMDEIAKIIRTYRRQQEKR
ncbi:MAG: BlaI/MecI/CopY family transcriptional regulator [Planctomycetota bacterium]